jgi:hypothetical protein
MDCMVLDHYTWGDQDMMVLHTTLDSF